VKFTRPDTAWAGAAVLALGIVVLVVAAAGAVLAVGPPVVVAVA
jgi:hypothetical protein